MDVRLLAYFVMLFWFGIAMASAGAAYFFLSLPMRRQERARFFLDLLEQGLSQGRNPELTMIEISRSRDSSMGVRFHLVAAYLEQGLRFNEALEKVPRFLSPQLKAILKTGEEIGDISKVLPACRQSLGDGLSQTRSAVNYVFVFGLVLTPVAPAIFTTLAIFVFPKFRQIVNDLEVPVPPFAASVMEHAPLLAQLLSVAGILTYLAAFVYVGGPRLARWCQSGFFPVFEWVAFQLPWRRKRMLRDFGAMLCVLLDAGVPEARAISLAGASTGNLIFQGRTDRVVMDLRAGHKLPDALRRLDEGGELRWRLTNALHATAGFRSALSGWLEVLNAKAFQQQQAAAQIATTALVLFNGTLVGILVICVFQILIAIVDEGVLW